MHVGGMGDEKAVAGAVGKVFARLRETAGGKGEVLRADIDPAKTTLSPAKIEAVLAYKGDLKDGAHQTSASGDGVYRGPGAPATGPPHHYVFEIFALDTKVDVPANAADPFDTRAKVLAAIQGHVVGKAVYMGLFHRPE